MYPLYRRCALPVCLFLCLFLAFSSFSAVGTELSVQSFQNPPEDCKPWVYWFWVNGNLSREGITADLEAMKNAGIGGVIIMEVDKGEPKGLYPFASEPWRELFSFMLGEAKRLCLKVNMNNDGGWCGSGGPWIPVDKSMQKVVWSETAVQGPCRIKANLSQPAAVDGYYRDITVLAFPTPAKGEEGISALNPKVTSNAKSEPFHTFRMLDRDPRTQVPFPRPVRESPVYVDFEFSEEVPVCGMTITLGGKNWILEGKLQGLDRDGGYCDIKPFKGFAPSITIDFPEQSFRKYRLLLIEASKPGEQMKTIGISGVDFCRDRINCIEQKSMAAPPINTVNMLACYPDASEGVPVPVGEVRDISDRMNGDGELDWEVPSGDWTILRIGHTTTGKTNHTSPHAGVGYECDRLRKDASTLHFEKLIGSLADESPWAVGNTFVSTHIDSWESGSQNWTPEYIREFKDRRGYDPTPYLPVIAGKIIGSREISERFLWDFRKTISELMLENYTDNISSLAHGKGLNLSIEAYRRCLTDELTYAGRADEPIAEFWAWPRYNFDYACTEMASSAHIYGKNIVGAEAFTS
ncbi:MAG: hypothetical protein IJS07_07835, partial [Bacteroidales bacterium]|nr:hypothetical protein [Bacteroidales bacterium]